MYVLTNLGITVWNSYLLTFIVTCKKCTSTVLYLVIYMHIYHIILGMRLKYLKPNSNNILLQIDCMYHNIISILEVKN